MSDKFPKQYILDRIGARQGSLKIKDGALATEATKFEEALLDKQTAALNKNLNQVEKAAKRARKAFESATTFDERQRALASFEGVSLDRVYTGHHSFSTSRHRTLDDVIRDRRDISVELDALAHAVIYLTDMPTMEFSMATLRTLGVASVLKFDLDARRAEAAEAERKAR